MPECFRCLRDSPAESEFTFGPNTGFLCRDAAACNTRNLILTSHALAWMIERASSPGGEPDYWAGGADFSTDNLRGVRFCRKSDADAVATKLLGVGELRVTEHAWPRGKT